jgi:hypothetical protein
MGLGDALLGDEALDRVPDPHLAQREEETEQQLEHRVLAERLGRDEGGQDDDEVDDGEERRHHVGKVLEPHRAERTLEAGLLPEIVAVVLGSPPLPFLTTGGTPFSLHQTEPYEQPSDDVIPHQWHPLVNIGAFSYSSASLAYPLDLLHSCWIANKKEGN